MGRRGVAVVGGVVAITIAIWIWQRGDDVPSSPRVEVSAKPPPTAARPQRVGEPSVGWYEQPGVAKRRIAGIVLDETTPVAGATVRLTSRLVMAGVAPELRVVTDASGQFDFGPHAALHYLVSADLPQRTMATAIVDLRTPVPSEDVHLVLRACVASLSGTIRDVTGGAIAKARITIGDGGLATTAGAITEASGKYQLCVPAGNPLVVVSAAGYADAIDREAVTGPLERDFVLVPEADIAGRVVHATDRRPIANAVVELRRVDRDVPSHHAVSDDLGKFHFAGAGSGTYALLAKADGVASVDSTHAIVKPHEASAEIECIVEDTVTVSGRLVEEGTETPVARTRIVLKRTVNDHDAKPQYGASSQADGSFTIQHVQPGEYQPEISSGRLANHTKNIVVIGKEVSGVVLEIDRGGSIAGHVTRGGLPAHGALVSARGALIARTATTDHAGAFTIGGLLDDSYEIYAESRRVQAFSAKQTVAVREDERKTGIELDLNLGGSIAGVVVDQDNSPVRGVVVKFSQLGGATVAVATTAKDGSFKASALTGGEYIYEVRPSEEAGFVYAPADRKRFTPIAVADATTHVTNVRVRVLHQNLSIAGRATGPGDGPVVGASITLHPGTGSVARTNATGAFEIRGLPEGDYKLLARSEHGVAYANAKAGQTDVQVRFAGLGALEVTLDGFTEETEVLFAGEHRTKGEKHVRLTSLRPGRFALVATSKSNSGSAMVEIVPGQTTKVVLRPGGYGWIKGTVSHQDTKEPFANVGCHCVAPGASVRTQTDASGTFLCPRMPAGRAAVMCAHNASNGVDVIANQEVRLALFGKPLPPRPPRLYAGFAVEIQLDRIRVRAVVKNTSAAKAGILVGDIIVGTDDRMFWGDGVESVMEHIEVRLPGVVNLKIERGDTEIVVPMTLEPRR